MATEKKNPSANEVQSLVIQFPRFYQHNFTMFGISNILFITEGPNN